MRMPRECFGCCFHIVICLIKVPGAAFEWQLSVFRVNLRGIRVLCDNEDSKPGLSEDYVVLIEFSGEFPWL